MRLLSFFLAFVSVLFLHSLSFSATSDGLQFEQQAQQTYLNADYEGALRQWEEALNIYKRQKDITSQARVLSNISLAYQQLGEWSKATANLSRCFELLNPEQPDHLPVFAQAYNTQGSLLLALGKTQESLNKFELAETFNLRLNSLTGVLRSQINQAQALQNLGFYRRAEILLKNVVDKLSEPNDLKMIALHNYGNILRLLGKYSESEEVLQQSLTLAINLDRHQEQAEILLLLGDNSLGKNDLVAAKNFFIQSTQTCLNDAKCKISNTIISIQLSQLRALIKTQDWTQAEVLWQKIIAGLNNQAQPNTNFNIYASIDLAESLITLQQNYKSTCQQVIIQLLNNAIDNSEILSNKRALSSAKGVLGGVYLAAKDLSTAMSLTQQALLAAKTINESDLIYRWQWQIGKIYHQDHKDFEAIKAYRESVLNLNGLSRDLVALNRDLQFSFRESVDPVYRELVSLLLAPSQVSQETLLEARQVIESLQLAELNNFLRNSCYVDSSVSLDNIINNSSTPTAVIYPIVLSDRIEIIVTLPKQPLLRFTSKVNQLDLTNTVLALQKTLVIRTKKDYIKHAKNIYNWLISPVTDSLNQAKISNLVFVLDGALRNIPMASLSDGNDFLIEKYNIAITPGLQLLQSRPVSLGQLKLLGAGLSKPKLGFAPLNYVKSELKAIEAQINSVVLLDESFTENALKSEIEFNSYGLVHLASHGQFSSNLNDTFVLASDKAMTINDLESMLKNRSPKINQAIELMVLSACETATGDEHASLGLAGMAVRAGARSTVASLWNINDEGTASFMKNFYGYLASQKYTKAEALRQAQLNFLKNRSFRHPFYWAPYVLVGNWT